MTTWPALGSQWQRTRTHGVVDSHSVELPEPITEHLTIHKIDPTNDLGRQIQGFIRQWPTKISDIEMPEDTYYATSMVVGTLSFYEVWSPLEPQMMVDTVESFGGMFKREEEEDE